MRRLLLIVAAVGFAAPALAAGGNVEVTVTFEGKIPTPKKIQPTTDTAICGQQDLVEESLLVDPTSRGVKSVVGWVKGSTGGTLPAKPVLDNKRCRYEPHVMVAKAKQKIAIKNSDRFLHTSQALAGSKSIFNVALPIRGQVAKKKFPKRGVYSVHCDVHSWMKAWVVVLEGEIHGVSDDQGKLTLTGVPAGQHEVELWHETLGTRVVKVTVEDGKTAKAAVKWARK